LFTHWITNKKRGESNRWRDWFIDARDCRIYAQHALAYAYPWIIAIAILYPWQEGCTRELERVTRVGSCQGDEEERNCDKGCWQTVTGTTLSATRFCAYHSPRVYHRRRQCRVHATDLIWSPSRSDPSTFCSLSSFAHTIFSEYTTWSRPLSLPGFPEVFLVFSCSCFPFEIHITRQPWCILKTFFPSWSLNSVVQREARNFKIFILSHVRGLWKQTFPWVSSLGFYFVQIHCLLHFCVSTYSHSLRRRRYLFHILLIRNWIRAFGERRFTTRWRCLYLEILCRRGECATLANRTLLFRSSCRTVLDPSLACTCLSFGTKVLPISTP